MKGNIMKKRILSITLIIAIMLQVLPAVTVFAGVTRPAEITQPEDEFSPFRESEHFLFDIPSSYLTGVITPEQLGWWLGEMDKLYDAMADFTEGIYNWRPLAYQIEGSQYKILINYLPDMPEYAYMWAYLGSTQMCLSDPVGTVEAISNGEVYWAPVHELGHNFGRFPDFNVEFTADFLTIYASVATGIPLVYPWDMRVNGNNADFETWYTLEYNFVQDPDIDWESWREAYPLGHHRRSSSIVICGMLSFVKDHGWEALRKTFGSYHDGSFPMEIFPYDDYSHLNDFFDRIDYFGNVDFRGEYLDYYDWLEYIEFEYTGQTYVPVRLGFIVNGGNGERITILDVLELLKFLAKIPDNALKDGPGSPSWNNSLITIQSVNNDRPSINDALEILKFLAGISPNGIENPQVKTYTQTN
jgi:hypothetical protein